MMNRSQKIALWIGIGVALVMLIFPPFYMGERGTRYALYTRPPQLAHTHPNAESGATYAANVNNEMLHTQELVVVLVTAAALVALYGERKEKRDTNHAEPQSVIARV